MIKGRVFRFQDNVDTDQMIPGKYLAAHLPPKVQATHCFENMRPEYAKQVKDGDIIVAGHKFGCGSSRAAAIPLKAGGINMIIARSFSRIFFRTSVNSGLLPIAADDIVDEFSDGDEVEYDTSLGVIKNLTTGKTVKMPAVPAFLQEILDAGDLLAYTRKKLGARG